MSVALMITARMETEGFIAKPARASRAKKKGSQAMVKYSAVKTEENKLRMDMMYFDPLTKIEHHVSSSIICNHGYIIAAN